MPIVSLAPGETRDVSFTWTPTKVGVYQASADVSYADKESMFTTPIIVGNLSVQITELAAGDFRLGDPFRVSVSVLNEWGDALPITVRGRFTQDGSLISSAETAPKRVNPLNEERLPLFFESKGVALGNAVIEVTAEYADKTVSRSLPVVVGVDSLTPASEVTRGSPVITVLIALIVLVALIAIAIVINRRRRPRRGGR